jgi:hypothetical protein
MTVTPFHTGLVVRDVDATRQRLSETIGARWASVRTEKRDIWTPSGIRTVEFSGTFTVDGPMHLELIRTVPGSLWEDPSSPFAVHHVGCWSTDIAKDSRRLIESGAPVVAAGGSDPNAPEHFVYHDLGERGYLELLDVAAQPMFTEWWRGRD